MPSGLAVTTQYRRITISTQNGVACESSPTAPVQVTVQSIPTAGVIAADQTICNGGDPLAFTSTTAGTGSGTITYRWESNTNLNSPSWSTIAGQTGYTYDVPSGLAVTTQYRRITISTQNGVICESAPTTPVQVTVQSTPTAGVIAADQTICNGGDPVAFNSTTDGSGSGTITYRWESNTNLGAPSWSAVSGATFATYDIPAGLAVTTQYRRITISTQNTVACESVSTNIVTVTVQSTSSAGAISTDQTICNGDDPVAFTSTTAGTGSGTISYRWESNTNLGSPSWSTIAGQIGATYDVPAGLTVTTQYRRITISTLNGEACESVPTAIVQITVQSIPTAGVIAADQTICNGGDPLAFASTTPGTGSGTITYRWESNTNLGTPSWSTIASQIGSTYDVPSGLAVTTQYRRVTVSTQNGVICESAPTSSIQVTVQSTPTAGVIAADQTICNGGDPVAFNSTTDGSGSGTITYRWESNTNLGAPSWSAVSGATFATYDIPAGLAVTTQYRRITISTENTVACESVPTNTVTATVQSTTSAGAITADQTICNGGDPVAFSSTTAGTGSGIITYRWESNTNLGTPSWSTIASQTGATYDVPSGLVVTTQYRRITISTLNSNMCESASTTPVQVTVNPTPTLTGAAQNATVCAGTVATINLAGLLPNSTSTISYTINGTNQTPVTNLVANAAGNASFTSPNLSATNNGQTLQITGVTTTSATPDCSASFTQNVTLGVNPNPTLSGATQDATVCNGSTATINLTGLLPNSVSTVSYLINGSAQTPVTVVTADGSGNANFTSAVLTAANNGQILQITGITTTSATPNCSSVFTQELTLSVDPVTVGGTVSANQTICSGNSPADLTLNGNTGSVVKWQKASDVVFSSPVDIAVTSTILTGATIGNLNTDTYFRAVVQSGSCAIVYSASVLISINPNPTLTGASQNATVCDGDPATINLAGLLPNSTSIISYSIDGANQTPVTGVVADAAGNASFTSPVLSTPNDSQTLQITGITATSAVPNCSSVFTQNVTLSVNPNPTLSGASQATTVCDGSVATVNLTGLLPNSVSTLSYSINGSAQTPETNIISDVSGNASFTSAVLSAANNGQILRITGISTTSATPNCSSVFSQNVTLNVNPTPTAIISGDNSVCQNTAPEPNITFTNPMALPVTVTYNIDGGANQTIDIGANSTSTETVSTVSVDTYVYNLVSVQYKTGPACINTISGSATVIIRPEAPLTPGAIAGNNYVIPATTETYSISDVTNATSYIVDSTYGMDNYFRTGNNFYNR